MLKKILISLAAIFFLLFAVLISIPLFFKDTVADKVKTAANNGLNAKVNFTDFDLTLISSFPNMGIQLNDLTVAGIDSFASDTLANIKKLQVNVNLMSVIKGETYEIRSVKLDQPRIYARVLESGKANWDITKPDTASSSSDSAGTFKAALQKYSIENGRIVYDDASLDFFMELDNVNHSGNGDFTQDLFTLNTSSDIEKLTLKYGDIPYLNKVKFSAELPLEIDMKQMKFTLNENKIQLNELILSLVGSLAMPNDTDMVMDFKFDAQKSDLKNFLSLIPAIYTDSFKDMEATGKFAFNGNAKGTYNEKSLPAFNVSLLIENGKIKYPSLPSAVNNIQVNAQIKNPDGVIDHTTVNIPAFHLELGQTPLDGRLLVKTPVSDPFIDMALKGRLDLKQLTTIFPLEGTSISGLLDADVQLAGNKSAVDKGRYESFKASGQMLASNFNYSGKDVSMPIAVPAAKMSFSPKNITLSNLTAKAGKSDFKAEGAVNNYLSFIFNKNQPLKGFFNVTSNLIDVNELMAENTEKPAEADTSALTAIKVPANIDFSMGLKADRILYDNYDIKNTRGTLLVKNQTIFFKDMGMNMLDGSVTMNGSYAAVDAQKPKVDIDFGIEKMSIQKAFATFNTVKLLAPIAQYTQGVFSTSLKFNSELDQNMMPVYSSINASGMTNIIEAVLKGFEPLNKLASALNTDYLDRLELHNVLAKFKIENGMLNVSPFNVKKGDVVMNVQGSNGLDKSLNYLLKIDIPRKLLGSTANDAANTLMAQLNSKAGTSLSVGETVKVNALVGGTITRPTVKLALAEDGAKEEAKALASQFIEEKKTALKDTAKQKAAELKAKAQEEVKQKTDTLKKQAEEKIKDEVKNKLNNLFKKKE